MLKTKLLLFTLIIVAMNGCTYKETIDMPKLRAGLFQIHYQMQFDGERVQTYIDGTKTFDSTVTTNNLLSLAKIITREIYVDDHIIKTRIDNIECDTVFNIPDTLIIGVTYDKTNKEIRYRFYYPPERPMYGG